MKFSTKIWAAAAGLLLLFSQIFSFWVLSQTQKEMTETVCLYEWKQMEQSRKKFEMEWRQFDVSNQREDSKVMAIALFRKYYLEDSALYYGEEELYNSTSYEFHIQNMKKGNYDIKGFAQEAGAFLVQVKEKSLLVQSQSVGPFYIVHFKNITQVKESHRKLQEQGFAGALVLSFLLAGVLLLMMRHILSPFYRLKDTANIIAQGHYEKRVPIEGKKDEIRQVGESFNRMADKIQEHINQLEIMNEKQRQLLGSLSHELKTPMTAICGYAETLQRVKLSKDRQEKALAYIERECKRLSRLSEKMLKLMELSNDQTKIHTSEILVSRLAAHAEKLTSYTLQERNIRLQSRISEDKVIVGDEDLLVSLLVNLIDNAGKASKPGSRILLEADERGIFVIDEGEGMEPEEIEKVTEAFYRIDKSRSRKEGGAGLGLALCCQIARLHHMKLVIESDKGKGSRIGVTF